MRNPDRAHVGRLNRGMVALQPRTVATPLGMFGIPVPVTLFRSSALHVIKKIKCNAYLPTENHTAVPVPAGADSMWSAPPTDRRLGPSSASTTLSPKAAATSSRVFCLVSLRGEEKNNKLAIVKLLNWRPWASTSTYGK